MDWLEMQREFSRQMDVEAEGPVSTCARRIGHRLFCSGVDGDPGGALFAPSVPSRWIFLLIFLLFSQAEAMLEMDLAKPEGLIPKKLIACGRLCSESLREPSGMSFGRIGGEAWLWNVNDSGNPAELIGCLLETDDLWRTGRQSHTLLFPRLRNEDWEDLAMDPRGYLIIGAFGDNDHKRKQYAVHRVPVQRPRYPNDIVRFETIQFVYQDPDSPSKTTRNDCEACFVWKEQLILLTKNVLRQRSDVYTIEIGDGHWGKKEAQLARFAMRLNGLRSITAADALPDGSRIVLLSYDTIWFLSPRSSKAENWFDPNQVSCLEISGGQVESICFLSPDSILISNEKRELFRVNWSDGERVNKRLHPLK
jgi:hypothetical protein